jgi:hypothetical protein
MGVHLQILFTVFAIIEAVAVTALLVIDPRADKTRACHPDPDPEQREGGRGRICPEIACKNA